MESPFGVDHGHIAKYSAAYGNNRVAIKDMAEKKAKKIKAMAKDKAKGMPKGKPGEIVAKPHEHVDSWFAGKTISKATAFDSRKKPATIEAKKQIEAMHSHRAIGPHGVGPQHHNLERKVVVAGEKAGKKAGKFAKTPRALALGAAGVAAAGGGYAYSQRKKSA
jgi:hypothetical protein